MPLVNLGNGCGGGIKPVPNHYNLNIKECSKGGMGADLLFTLQT